jgi:hypothetical protein
VRPWRTHRHVGHDSRSARLIRFAGDEEFYEALERWRANEKRLFHWECFQRQLWLRWRDDHYRQFAASLLQRYRTVVVEDTVGCAGALLSLAADEVGEGSAGIRRGGLGIEAGGLIEVALRERCAPLCRSDLAERRGCKAPRLARRSRNGRGEPQPNHRFYAWPWRTQRPTC